MPGAIAGIGIVSALAIEAPPRRSVMVASGRSTTSSDSEWSATTAARPRMASTRSPDNPLAPSRTFWRFSPFGRGAPDGMLPGDPAVPGFEPFLPDAMFAPQTFHMSEGGVQPQVVALCSESADLPDAPRRGDRSVAERLPRVQVRQVDLDRRDRDRLDRKSVV